MEFAREAGWREGIGLLMAGVLCVLIVCAAGFVLGTAESVRAMPLGQHCYDVGPLPELPPDWCGCTWGAVFVNGNPVDGALVTLSYGSGITSTTTSLSVLEPYPFYAIHADGLGARYGSPVSVTATYRGRSITRTVRLIPDGPDKEQVLNFAFEEQGHWIEWAGSQAVQALAARVDQLWVGTPAGPVRWDLTTGISQTFSIGLPSNDVRALAIGPEGDVWAGTPLGLSRYNGDVWMPQYTGLASSNIRALAVGPDGTVWAGASHTVEGGVSRYDGQAWQPMADFNGVQPNLVSALAVDSEGRPWVGTDGYGVSRWNGASWRTFTTVDGLASEVVYAIASEPGSVWFGTWSYVTSEGAFGGVGRYDLVDDTWVSYRQDDGLVLDDVVAVAIDSAGGKWFGTWGGGLGFFDDQNWWAYSVTSGLGSNHVRALAADSTGAVWVGSESRIDRHVAGAPGEPPVIIEVVVSPAIIMSGQPLLLQATAADGDENGGSVVSYEWWSELDGSLGSEASFSLDTSLLRPGMHMIGVRALDDEGVWSALSTSAVTVLEPHKVWLPLVMRDQ